MIDDYTLILTGIILLHLKALKGLNRKDIFNVFIMFQNMCSLFFQDFQ